MLMVERKRMEKLTDHQPQHRERYDVEVDGQWLTFPFPFVHHQPLHIF